MDGMDSCARCGNDINPGVAVCPHCQAEQQPTPVRNKRPGAEYRVVNLEKNMPTVDHALGLFEQEVSMAPGLGYRVLVLIHGYGSSGRGGSIKKAVRRRLDILRDKGVINDVLVGEECRKRSGHARHLLRRFPVLEEYVRHPNPGISLVVL